MDTASPRYRPRCREGAQFKFRNRTSNQFLALNLLPEPPIKGGYRSDAIPRIIAAPASLNAVVTSHSNILIFACRRTAIASPTQWKLIGAGPFRRRGCTDDLTTDLSHLRGSFVIARNTAFIYKGQARRREADRALGFSVRYLLEGARASSFRQTKSRSTPSSSPTETGAHVWADLLRGRAWSKLAPVASQN